MPNYKLYYFDFEIARLLFALSGTKYEDIRKGGEDWAAFKPQTPFGQVPVLEVDGKMYGQSIAIANYLAREFGFYGKNNADAIAIDQIVQLTSDLKSGAVKVFLEKDEAKKAELQKNFGEVEVPKYMGFYKALLAKNATKSGYFVGSSTTLADLVVYDVLSGMEQRHPGMLSKFPEVKALCDKVVNDNPKLKEYLANRKETTF